MNRFRRPQGLVIGPTLLALVWTVSCARPAGLQNDNAAAPADEHQVPFHDVAGTPVRQSDASTAADNPESPEAALPFHDAQNLPAGTLLTVRLKNPISAENPGARGTFEAVVDEAVVVEGNRLVPRGTTVAGRVESARASNVGRNRGYVRLVLDSIRLGEVSLPIQTSSLFVRGNPSRTDVAESQVPQKSSAANVIHLEKGRRLTFRLTEPAYVAASQRSRVDR
jgi:hypothetical protein